MMNSYSPEFRHPISSSTDTNSHPHHQMKVNANRDTPRITGHGQQQQKLISTFDQLVENLMAYLCPPLKDNNEVVVKSIKPEELNSAEQKINGIFHHFEKIISNEYPQNRRQDASGILHYSRIIYLHILYLQNKCEPREILNSQIESVLDALQHITKYSHDQFYGHVKALENRKFLISLGLIEAITHLFVLDIAIFELKLDGYEKCSKFRRSIGNALMNLVYQQPKAKQKLCSNRLFLQQVANVILEVRTRTLVQFYAGLIQNVSYNAGQEIAHQLAITVQPLVRTAISIVYDADGTSHGGKSFSLVGMPTQQKQHLLKILSALWNLAEDLLENKNIMCNIEPKFVPLLLKIMYDDQRELQFIQAAVGILKHLCTFILHYNELFIQIYRQDIVRAFIRQLVSSSTDLVMDSLNALSLLSIHPLVSKEILRESNPIQQINVLLNSKNEGISRASRMLLDTIYSVSSYYQQMQQAAGIGMSASMAPGPATFQQNRSGHQPVVQNHLSNVPQYFTLPRTSKVFRPMQPNGGSNWLQLQENTPKGALKQAQAQLQSGSSTSAQTWLMPHDISQQQQIHSENPDEDNEHLEKTDELGELTANNGAETGQDLPTSVQCTRDVSPQSCSFNSVNGEKNGEEWPSIQSTSVQSSGAQSRASASELPDSPSQCASHKAFQLKEIEMQIYKALNENKQSGQCTNANVSGDAESHQAQDEKTCDEAEDEDILEIKMKQSENLLADVIRHYMPKPSSNLFPTHFTTAFTQNSTPALTPISSNSPCKSPTKNEQERSRKKRYEYDAGGLLNESIAAVMPLPMAKTMQNFGTSRNTSGSETSPHTNSMMKKHNNSDEDESNDQLGAGKMPSLQMPVDVAKEIKAHWITLDCQNIPTTLISNNLLNSQGGSTKESPKKGTAAHGSHIPILATMPTTTPTGSEHSKKPEGERSKPSSGKEQKCRKSPRKPLAMTRKQLPPPPALAPKPKILHATKMKRPNSGDNNDKESTAGNGQKQHQIVTL